MKGESLRWSPKGAKVALTKPERALTGSFALGPRGSAPIAVKLEKTANAAHFDVLWIDVDRDGKFGEAEKLTTQPSETRGKWWSSFEAELKVAIPAEGDAKASARAYPVSLWFVEDPLEPEAEPALRRSRRGWHEGVVEIGGKPAFVLVTEMEMDGVFDQRDSWMLARERVKLLGSDSW